MIARRRPSSAAYAAILLACSVTTPAGASGPDDRFTELAANFAECKSTVDVSRVVAAAERQGFSAEAFVAEWYRRDEAFDRAVLLAIRLRLLQSDRDDVEWQFTDRLVARLRAQRELREHLFRFELIELESRIGYLELTRVELGGHGFPQRLHRRLFIRDVFSDSQKVFWSLYIYSLLPCEAEGILDAVAEHNVEVAWRQAEVLLWDNVPFLRYDKQSGAYSIDEKAKADGVRVDLLDQEPRPAPSGLRNRNDKAALRRER